jgi:transcriptional regulator with XRE-family HTH domain
MRATRWTRDPILMDLIRIRYKQGLTGKVVADRIGVQVSQLAQWEAGHRRPQVNNVTAWARALGYELSLRPTEIARGESR